MAQSKAVNLLSSQFIPHDQHEFTLIQVCDKCKQELALACLVCDTSLCNNFRNVIYPHKDDEGIVTKHESHPVQCPCTMREFQLALMKARKENRSMFDSWENASPQEKIAPLAATCFSRSLITFSHNSATALDFKNEERLS